MAVEITGSGYNSKVKLYNIHQGNGYFRKDTSTTHSQVKLLQSALTDLGYDTQGADGKYGNNTLAAVKKFQEANNLTADGLFGKNSLTALESILGTHLDPENCETASGSVTTANLTVTEYIQNLESYCNSGWKYGSGYNASKKLIDCAWYPYKARSDQGAHGCTTEYNGYLSEKGKISSYNDLKVGMEVFQQSSDDSTKKSHMGVYAGKVLLRGELKHAVYQSCSSHSNIAIKYNDGVANDSGPNLTEMKAGRWKYWGWSKYVKHD